MDIIDQFPQIITLAFKILIILGLVLYCLFAAIMVRQERMMDKVIDETFEPVLRILVLLHLAGAIGLLVVSIVTL